MEEKKKQTWFQKKSERFVINRLIKKLKKQINKADKDFEKYKEKLDKSFYALYEFMEFEYNGKPITIEKVMKLEKEDKLTLFKEVIEVISKEYNIQE